MEWSKRSKMIAFNELSEPPLQTQNDGVDIPLMRNKWQSFNLKVVPSPLKARNLLLKWQFL